MALDENERDENGRATPDAVSVMTGGVHCAYDYYYLALQSGDAQQVAHHAAMVRQEMGALLTAIGEALGDLPKGSG